MEQKPIAREQLKQLLQLQNDGVGIREMARHLGVSRNSVRKYLSLLSNNDLKGQTDLDNTTIAERAYQNDSMAHDTQRLEQLMLHFKYAEHELGKTGVTRQLLWQEYMLQYPDGYVYSHYCYHLNTFLKKQDVAMHLE